MKMAACLTDFRERSGKRKRWRGISRKMGSASQESLKSPWPKRNCGGRLLDRGEKEGRSDDTPETIAARLGVYKSETAPLIDFYRSRNLLRQVDGLGSPDEVFARITSTIDGFHA